MSLSGTAPLVPVSDVARSVRFYTETLGFDQVIDNPAYGYACFRRGDAMVAILRADDDEAINATSQHIAAQIWVESVDALWDKWKSELSKLPEGRVRGPLDQPYGTRELHVKCPDGFLMFFTEDRPSAVA